MAILLKFILVLGLCAARAFFLLTGMGVDVPFIEYSGFKGRNIPAGAFLVIAGIALAALWKISESEEYTTTTTTTKKDGATEITTTETKMTKDNRTFKGPFGS